MKTAQHLTTRPIPELIRKVSIPASVGYFFYTMYNVVDTYFSGLISTRSLAALSLSLPVFFIIIAMGSGIGTGTTALIANALGAKNEKKAKFLAFQGILFGSILSILITILGLYASPALFRLLGATDAYLEIALIYMNKIFWGALFFVLVFMFNAILNALGDTKSFRNFLIFGFFLNLILDPWFIYGGLGVPPLKIGGIALATVLIQILGCAYLGLKVFRTGMITNKKTRDFVPDLGAFREIAQQGLPASINMLTVGMGIFVITYFVSQFGEKAVAAYGAAMRVEQIVLIPTIGLNVATLTLVAQNNGAKLFNRIRETRKIALKYGAMIMAVGTVVVLILAEYLMRAFSNDANVIGIGALYLRIDALVFYAYVILFVNVAVLQGIKRPMPVVLIGVFRQIIAPSVVFYVLIFLLGSELVGVWCGIFGITWGSAIFIMIYVRRTLRAVLAPDT